MTSVGLGAITFPGLSPGLLGGTLAGAALLTILLYLLRLRRRPLLVPFLPLWESLLLEKKATAWKSRLQRLFSLLLSLVLVGALIFALADPQTEREREGRSVVVLLDVGASMAHVDEGKSRLARAKEKLKSWFPSFVGGDQLLVVELGMRPRPLSAWTKRVRSLAEPLQELSTLDVHPDLAAGLSYARDALRGRESPEIVLLSDGAFSHLEDLDLTGFPPISFESVAPEREPESQDNLAITTFSARRYPLSGDRFEVLVEVAHRGEDNRLVELSLFEADDKGRQGEVVEVVRLDLSPGEVVSRSFQNLAHAEHGLIAEIRYLGGPEEAFLADNVARTLLAPRLPVSILVVGEENTFLDAALLVEDSFVVTRVSEAGYPPPGDFQITVFDGVFPQRAARTGAAIYLGAPPQGESEAPVAAAEELSLFGFDTWDKESDVFRLIDPYDVQVLEGASLVPGERDQVLGRSGGRPIFVSGERPEGRFLALGFSPQKSDFVLRAVWPLFVVNLVDEVFPRGRGSLPLGFATGETWRPPVAVEPGEETARVVGPLHLAPLQERVVPVADGRAVFFGQRAGFYEVKSSAGSTRFAASMKALSEEGAVPRKQLTLPDDGNPVPSVGSMAPRSTTQPWYWLLVFVAALSFVEWWTFHRRWTV